MSNLINPTSIITFGKYKGEFLCNIMQIDIDYVDWLLNNPLQGKVTQSTIDMFNEMWEQRNYKKHGFRNDNLNT